MADEQTADFFAPPTDAPPEPPAGDAPIILGAPDEAPDFSAAPAEAPAGGDEQTADFFSPPTDEAPAETGGEPILMGYAPPEDTGAPGDAAFAGSEPAPFGVVEDVADDDEAEMPEPEPEGPPEPSPMQKWNDEFAVLLRERKDNENSTKAEHVEAARVDMEKFQAERDARKEAKMARNREEEQDKLEALEADLENDNSWQRVVKLVELQHDTVEGAADVHRMRDVFIHLKNDTTKAAILA